MTLSLEEFPPLGSPVPKVGPNTRKIPRKVLPKRNLPVTPLPLSQTIEKTRFCYSVLGGGPCREKSACTWAHTPRELSLKPCGFGDLCRYVRRAETGWVNREDRICPFQHPGETADSLGWRVGYVGGILDLVPSQIVLSMP